VQSVRTQTNTKYRIQNTTYKYKHNHAVNKSKSVDRTVNSGSPFVANLYIIAHLD